MLVQQAKAAARAWVAAEAGGVPGFVGAFFSGSINEMAEDAELPETSDVDLLVVMEGHALPPKPGKFRYRGALLEASYLSSAEIATPAQVLGSSHLAYSLQAASVILDPTGRLAALQAAVARDYARRDWVIRRCAHARDKVLRHLARVREGAPRHDQAIAWLFGTGVTTHVLLVAGLRNPTVRKRYLAVRELLSEVGRSAFYPTLLALLGCAEMGTSEISRHLDVCAEVFDAASAVITSPFPFAADISAEARPVAIDGSRELIARGDHREAVFWIAVTQSRCQQVLAADAPEEIRAQYRSGYRRLLAELGVSSYDDARRRAQRVQALLPRIWQEAEAIMKANSQIET